MKIAYKVGEKGDRPWGTWEVIAIGENYIVKEIYVKKGQSLSLQTHDYRDELWYAVKGKGTARVGETVTLLHAGETVFIPKKSLHRLSTEENDVTIIEIQTGEILDEDDIKRIDDRYGRV